MQLEAENLRTSIFSLGKIFRHDLNFTIFSLFVRMLNITFILQRHEIRTD